MRMSQQFQKIVNKDAKAYDLKKIKTDKRNHDLLILAGSQGLIEFNDSLICNSSKLNLATCQQSYSTNQATHTHPTQPICSEPITRQQSQLQTSQFYDQNHQFTAANTSGSLANSQTHIKTIERSRAIKGEQTATSGVVSSTSLNHHHRQAKSISQNECITPKRSMYKYQQNISIIEESPEQRLNNT